MKRNLVLIVIFIIIVFSITACNSNANYDTVKNNFIKTDEKISCNIEYPSISQLKDQKKQEKINVILKDEAIKVLNYYTDSFGFTELTIEYLITLANKNVLSIQFSGIGDVENAAHPNNIFYTINIDIEKGTKLRLIDVVKIDSDFVDKLYSGNFKALWPEQGEYISHYSEEEMLEYLENADSLDNIDTDKQSDVFSYFTQDGIGISIPVSHSIGDHAEFEISYTNLGDSLIIKLK